jgi:hypothetical protein
MKLRMSVQKSPKLTDEVHFAGPVVSVGRNPDAQLVLEHDAVSWDHAQIEMSPYQATLSDMGSTNGTFKNGQKVVGNVPLWPGDAIKLGQTGPTLTVLELDLTSNGAVAPPAVKSRAAVPVGKPAQGVSETRGIAMQAVQELMEQQNQLRAQREAHAKHKRTFLSVSLALLALLMIVGVWLAFFHGKLGSMGKRQDDFSKTVDDIGVRVEKTHENIKKLGDQVDGMADHFGKIDQQLEDHRKQQEKRDQALEQVAMNVARAEATQRGGIDKLKEMGVTLEQMNQRLANGNRGGGGAVNPAPAARPAGLAKPIRIEPGQKVDVIIKNGGFFSGSLVSVDGRTVKVQTIPDPAAKPTEWDIRIVQAFQTRDGIFAFNESTGQFEPGVTFYRFNKSNGMMERMEESHDTYLAQDAQILGPTNSAHALLSVGPTGEWCVGLPLPMSRSPQALEAYHFKEIITSKGVYAFDEQKREFVYKSHVEFAQEAKNATDKYWEDWRQKNWDRRIQSYQLGTERLRALAPLFWARRWWWW